MHPRYRGVPTDDRIMPTPEDVDILKRNVNRLVRWDNEIHGAPLSRRPVISQSNLLPTIRRACDDYLHFKPKS